MSDAEDRLRQALHEHVERVEGDPDAWAHIQSGVRARRTARLRTTGLLAAAAVIAIAVGVVALANGDDGPTRVETGVVDDGPSPTTSSTTRPVPAPDDEDELFPGIWPFASEDEAEDYADDPGTGMFFDGEQTALEFAREYLGMPNPRAASVFVGAEDSVQGSISIRPKPGSPLLTQLHLLRVGGTDGPWTVTDAMSGNIQVDVPAPGGEVDDPMVVEGTSTAFEATVLVSIRLDGKSTSEPTDLQFVMGGGNGEMGPFSDEIGHSVPAGATGAVIFTTESAEDGTVNEATVIRVRFGS